MAHQIHYRAICRRTNQYLTPTLPRTLRCNGSECSHQASLARAWRSLYEVKMAIELADCLLLGRAEFSELAERREPFL